MTKTQRFTVTFMTGTSRHDAQAYTKQILSTDIVAAARLASLTIGARPNTVILSVALTERPFA